MLFKVLLLQHLIFSPFAHTADELVPSPMEIADAMTELDRVYTSSVTALITSGPYDFGVTIAQSLLSLSKSLGAHPSERQFETLDLAAARWEQLEPKRKSEIRNFRTQLQALKVLNDSVLQRTDNKDPTELGLEILRSMKASERDRAVDLVIEEITGLIEGNEALLALAKNNAGGDLTPESIEKALEKLSNPKLISDLLRMKGAYSMMGIGCRISMSN